MKNEEAAVQGTKGFQAFLEYWEDTFTEMELPEEAALAANGLVIQEHWQKAYVTQGIYFILAGTMEVDHQRHHIYLWLWIWLRAGCGFRQLISFQDGQNNLTLFGTGHGIGDIGLCWGCVGKQPGTVGR